MNDTLLGALIGVIGVLLGTGLGWGLNIWQGQAHDRQARRGVRLLLRLECAQNLDLLNEFWRQVESTEYQVAGVAYSPEEREFHKRQRLASVPLPAWGHLMWESQAGLMAAALSQGEIQAAYRLHTDLDTFAAMRSKIQEMLAEEDGRRIATSFNEWIRQRRNNPDTPISPEIIQSQQGIFGDFNDATMAEWRECEAIHNRAGNGNPILDDALVIRVVDRLKRLRKQAT